jgi:hypothetical protein
MMTTLGYDGKWTLWMNKLSLFYPPSDVMILDPILEGRKSNFLS